MQISKPILIIPRPKLFAMAARFAMDHSNKMGNNLTIKMWKLLATADRFAMGPLNANWKTNPDYSKAEIVCYGC